MNGDRHLGSFRTLILLIALSLCACADMSRSPAETISGKSAEITKRPKLLLILPAGAGALQVIINIAAALEKDLGIEKLGSIIDNAGGSSSGAIAASALTNGIPTRYSARELKAKTPILLEKTLPELQAMLSVLKKEYDLNLVELNTLLEELITLSLKTPGSLVGLFDKVGAMLERSPSIDKKLEGQLGVIAMSIKHAALIHAIKHLDLKTGLRNFLIPLLGDAAMQDKSNSKLVTLAAHAHSPVFFAHELIMPWLKVPQGVLSTPLYDALVASCAIPGLITNFTVPVIMPDGPEKPLSLQDGVFATKPLNYDPSEHFYKLYSAIFPNEDLLMLYMGNGSQVDQKFRAGLSNCHDGLCQKHEEKRTISFMAIDAVITDSSGNNLFSLAQVDASSEMATLLAHAAIKAIESTAYKNALRTLKAQGFAKE